MQEQVCLSPLLGGIVPRLNGTKLLILLPDKDLVAKKVVPQSFMAGSYMLTPINLSDASAK